MTTIDAQHGEPPAVDASEPGWKRYKHSHHWRSNEEEFDACKLGFWLFLATEVLLFAGLFCAYAMYRMLYPEAFANGSHYLDVKWGATNTVVLLLSSFTVAMSIRSAQLNQRGWLHFHLIATIVLAVVFVCIKGLFEYTPKWSGWFFVLDPALSHHVDSGKTALGGLFHFVEGYGGKRPGVLFDYAFASHPQEPLWWSVYYCATGIHALHVLIGASLLGWCLYRSVRHRQYGPTHYTMLENSGLYWHLVDLIWIFLFPLLYLIH